LGGFSLISFLIYWGQGAEIIKDFRGRNQKIGVDKLADL
jgi:hypothetical protein